LKLANVKESTHLNPSVFSALVRNFSELAKKVMSAITTADLASWRDARLVQVSPSSVVREINLFRNVFAVAAREWSWLPEPAPWAKLKPPDTRRLGQGRPNSTKSN
jgi:hypothetical protein